MSQNNKRDDLEELNKGAKTYAQYGGMAFEMFATVGLGAFIGWKLDKWLKMKTPIFTILFLVFFTGISFYSIIKRLSKK